jgi:hypothetical protein
MGGSYSRASTSVGNEIINHATLSTYQNCVSSSLASNDMELAVDAGGSVQGVRQSAFASIDSDCVSKQVQASDFANNVSAATENSLKSQDEFMSRWMSVDGTNVEGNITNKISNLYDVINQQDCIKKISAENKLRVAVGAGASVKDVTQSAVAQAIGDCVTDSQQGAKAVGTVASQLQQHADVTSKGPLSILSDLGKNFLYMAVLGFIAFVILSYITARYGKKGPDGKMHNPLGDAVKEQGEGALKSAEGIAEKAAVLV